MFAFDFVNEGGVFVSFLCLTFWKSRLEIELPLVGHSTLVLLL